MRLLRFFSIVLAMLLVTACIAGPTAQEAGDYRVGETTPSIDLAEQGDAAVEAADIAVAAEGLPLGLELAQFYDVSLTDGAIPDTGAVLEFHLDEPLKDGQVAAIARWLPDEGRWEALPSTTSDDGLHISTITDHFSEYGVVLTWIERLDLAQRLLAGNAAEPPTCDTTGLTGEEPTWSDTQFFADKLSPTLWCVSGVHDEPDQLAVRFVWSRATAARIDIGLEPVHVSTDFFGSNLATQLLSRLAHAELSLDSHSQSFLVQPLGEYTFIFERDHLNAYYAQHGDEPLIEVSTNLGFTVLGLAYDQLMEFASPAEAAMLVFASVGSCPELTKNGQVESLINLAIECLGSLNNISEVTQRLMNEEVLSEPLDLTSLTQHGSKGASMLESFLGYVKIFQTTHVVTSSLTDAQLNDITRQLQYAPSMDETLRLARARQTEEFNACRPIGEEIPFRESPGPGQCWYVEPLDITHPHHGETTFVLGTIGTDAYAVRNAYWLLDADGQVIERRLGEENPAWQISAPKMDGSGNILYTYNPGRSDGCVALRPEGEWFNGFGTDPLEVPEGEPDYHTRFYGCIWHDEENDGVLEIIYQPSGGAAYYTEPELYRWNGEDYEFSGISPVSIYGDS